MLDLLISILMSLGFLYEPSSSKIKVDQAIVTKIQSNSNYDAFGGDAALFNLAEISSKPNEDVVIIVETDPTAKE
ncbi:MAG TPA: hypothetical protein PLU53_10515 [Bacteroidia bacterium]|nr:hypothetical protein [Bacteroidia bacterium]